jgi:dienelactone hydrolase
MRRRAPLLAFLLAAAAGAQAPPEAGTFPDLRRLEPGVVHSGLPTTRDPSQTFDLYLPSSFDAGKRWPLLLVFDPRSRGRLAAEIFVPGAERFGWIVASSNNTRSDGPWEPNERAVNAMFPDLMARLPVDPQRLYATGFSGGAMLAWVVGVRTGQLAGVISVGGRPPDNFERDPAKFALWAEAGTDDFNHDPTRELDRLGERGGRPHRLEFFAGDHQWFSATEAERALAWMELAAMRERRRPVDSALAARLCADDLAGADALLAANDRLAARRRLLAFAEACRGFADVAPAEARAAQLARDPAVRRALKDEEWGVSYEQGARWRLAQTLAALRDEVSVPPTSRLASLLGLREMQATAALPGPRGEAGRRVLAQVRVQFGFYLMRDLFAARDWARALPGLELAAAAAPEDVGVRYNLACAQARTGKKAEALASLARALDLGLPHPEQMATDEDLASLRGDPAFEALLARARGVAAPPP